MALSHEYTGKYTSANHEAAIQSGRLTAGEAAKIISKQIGKKVLAKQVLASYRALNGFDPEWHHSGFYSNGSRKKVMGRTWFLEDAEVSELAAKWVELQEKIIEDDFRQAQEEKKALETDIQGFYYVWDYDYGGYHGKKRNYKVLKAYEGNELEAPKKNFTPCDLAEFEAVKLFEGRAYYGWDEPSHADFTREKVDEHFAELQRQERVKRQQEEAAIAVAAQEKANEEKACQILDGMVPQFIAAGVNFQDRACAWYIYSRFFEGIPQRADMSKRYIKVWLQNKNS